LVYEEKSGNTVTPGCFIELWRYRLKWADVRVSASRITQQNRFRTSDAQVRNQSSTKLNGTKLNTRKKQKDFFISLKRILLCFSANVQVSTSNCVVNFYTETSNKRFRGFPVFYSLLLARGERGWKKAFDRNWTKKSCCLYADDASSRVAAALPHVRIWFRVYADDASSRVAAALPHVRKPIAYRLVPNDAFYGKNVSWDLRVHSPLGVFVPSLYYKLFRLQRVVFGKGTM
jgi:hypothetical protein